MTTPAYTVWERRTAAPSLVFDLVDRHARDRGIVGPNPRVRGRVRYRIVATEANHVRTGLPEPLNMVTVRNTAGYDLWFGLVTGREGVVRRYRPDPPPAIVVEIAAERYQRVETVIASLPRPDTPQRFALEPGWAYEFPTATSLPGSTGPTLLRGTLRNPDGTGIASATVRVNPPPAHQPAPNPVYTTDATGNWVLPFADDVTTTAAAPVEILPTGGPLVVVPEVTITRGDTSALRQASLAGGTRRATGAAVPGVTVTTDVAPGISTLTDAEGRWELWLPIEQFLPTAGPQPAVVTATPPQGAALVLDSQVRPRATTRVDPFVFP